ncbi:MAG: PQQ-dependent sugar dehydrogenase [Longimicrobiales bacterium]
MRSIRWGAAWCALVVMGCDTGSTADDASAEQADTAAATASALACDEDNGGLTLPAGFCALVVIDDAAAGEARARHIAVAPNGDIFVAVQGRSDAETAAERGGIVALRDTNGDGKVDEQATFGPEGGTGLELRDGNLYFATNSAVLRYRMGDGLEPVSGPDTLVYGLPDEHSHTAKSIALGPDGALFVNIGAPTNACQPIGQDRQAGVAGQDPCPQLETRGGVWRFDVNALRQTQADGERWATGIRNAVALAVNPANDVLFAVQHGRDQLNLWPGFTEEDNAVGPAEEMQWLAQGSDFGWPYCYFDTRLGKRVLNPEYGGDGQEVGRCAEKDTPLLTFPGHWAPNDIVFYMGEQFPPQYRGGAFIAFHGSWNRAPMPQAGYRVMFVPFAGEQPAGQSETFANGFAGENPTPDAEHRPMGLAVGPDGSLYITDSNGGRVWRVMYRGT